MAAIVVVDGPALIRTGTGSSDALEDLGYTINGVRITEQVYTSDVPGDQNGGDEGPPIDVQYFGEIHIVELEMSKWDTAVADKIQPKLKGGTAGAIGTAGSLYAAGGFAYRLLISPTSRPRNYLAAIPRDRPWEVNKGTKFSTLRLVFECHAVSGTIYNTTTS